MGWKSKKDGIHFNNDKNGKTRDLSDTPDTEVNIEIDNNSDDFAEGVRKDFAELQELGFNDKQRKAVLDHKRKMTQAEFYVSGGETYETDIEFLSATRDNDHFSIKGDVPMLAMYYQNKSPEKQKAFRHLIETKGKNWRLYKNGEVIETSDSFDGIFKKWDNLNDVLYS